MDKTVLVSCWFERKCLSELSGRSPPLRSNRPPKVTCLTTQHPRITVVCTSLLSSLLVKNGCLLPLFKWILFNSFDHSRSETADGSSDRHNLCALNLRASQGIRCTRSLIIGTIPRYFWYDVYNFFYIFWLYTSYVTLSRCISWNILLVTCISRYTN